MKYGSKLITLAAMALGLLAFAAAPVAEAQTTPTVVHVVASAPPAIPAGMKVACTHGTDTVAMALRCPVILWGGYTYWAFSYVDDRRSMGIVAYDAAGKVVAQWEKAGARYLYSITLDPTYKNVVFTGQSYAKIIMKWSELFPPAAPPATPGWQPISSPAGATLKQLSVGSANAIWGLDTTGSHWKWSGTAWEKKGCCVGTLSAAADGTLWATHPLNANAVLRWTGTQWDANVPQKMKQVAVVNATTVWGLDDAGSHFKLNGAAWEKKGCCVSQISAGTDGVLWATHPPAANSVLRWTSTQWDGNFPKGMVLVSVGNAQNIWGLDGSDQIFKWTGSAWEQKPGALRNIAVAGDGTVWGLNAQGLIWRWVP